MPSFTFPQHSGCAGLEGRWIRGRRGLSLLEVILAIAIFGASLAVIGELVRIGNVNAMAARDLSDGQRICSNLMNEIAAGVTPPTAVSQATCPEDETWLYTVTTDTTEVTGLLSVTVIVEQDPQFYSRPHSFSLVCWVVDPAALPAATTTEGGTTSSSSSSGSSGNSSSGNSSSNSNTSNGNSNGNSSSGNPSNGSSKKGGGGGS